MVLIPSDAGINLRQPGDNPLLPVARVAGIPADLPDLRQGQSFTANIQEVLPENTYRALVAGRSITLSLPGSAKAGDTLELVVVDRTPKGIIAQFNELAQGQKFAANILEVLPGNTYRAMVGGRPVTLQLDQPASAGDTLELVVAGRTPGGAVIARPEQLAQGQTFTADILETLPGRNYLALVNGKTVTLQLDQPASVGEKLELQVVARTPQLVTAQRAEPGAAAGSYPYTSLSRAGQMISALLAPEGKAPPAAALNRGQPLLAQPPQSGAELASVLSKAVTQSGLFYEAHQAQWVAGKLPLAALLEEPQGQHSEPATIAAQAAPTGRPGEIQAPTSHAPEVPAARAAAPAAASAEPARSQAALPAQALPADLRPLVQQQLDAAATQRLLWHGEVWPGQTMQWQVEHDQSGSGSGAEAEERWHTTLRLSAPRLGEVQAAIQLSGGGVRIALATSYGASATDLRAATPALEQALASAGVPLLGITVKHEAQ